MLLRYLNSFFPILVVLTAICSALPIATRSHVPAGTVIEETWRSEITLDTSDRRHYRVDDEIKEDLEKGVMFVGTGSVRVTSSKVEITAKQVSWDDHDETITAPGAVMVSHVKWEAPAGSANGAVGDIRVAFPKIRGIPSYTPNFRSGGGQKTGDGQWIFREVTTYRSHLSLLLGRFFFALYAGLPMAIAVHSLWWLWVLRGEKRLRLAALAQPDGEALPRMFYPSPTAEWLAWTLVLLIFGGLGCMLVGFAMHDGFLSSVMQWVIIIFQAAGVFVGLLTVLIVRANVLTVRIDDDAIALAKGRGQPRWITARWADLKSLETKYRTYKGTRVESMHLRFPDGRKKTIAEYKVQDYRILRDTSFALYARHHPAPQNV